MRYDKRVYFESITPGAYDPTTGDYGEDTMQSVMRLASVYDTRQETMQIVYGGVKQGSLTLHLQNHYDAPFDRIRIGDTAYQVDYRRKFRIKESFVVSEVE